MTPRFDRARPESPATQALIQQRAAAKRVRKARARVRRAELTELGRLAERMRLQFANNERSYISRLASAEDRSFHQMLWREWSKALDALYARRAQS